MAPPLGCRACLRAPRRRAACVLLAGLPRSGFGLSTVILPSRSERDIIARSTFSRLPAGMVRLNDATKGQASMVRRLPLHSPSNGAPETAMDLPVRLPCLRTW